jgi:hypothetical protein
MKKQDVEEFMSFVSSLRENPEEFLKSEGYTCNLEKYAPDNYTMRVWVKDTDGGRLIVAVHDEQTWNVNPRYRNWCNAMLESYRELGYTEAHIRTEVV